MITKKMSEFLSDLANLLDRYDATLGYTTEDDGLHAEIDEEDICIGFPTIGTPSESIRETLAYHKIALPDPDL